ncbi:MAG: DUF86 domain-containing protein [candidate division NC10 bacterium]|nr:DUF86 domain-containing protein [candidate division NC10 bacterium]
MKSNQVFLKHILDEINFLVKETDEIKFEEFMKNEVLKRACTRSLEIIGEAVKNLSSDFRKKYKNVDWKKIAGMRDKIIHHYFGVRWDVVWDVIKNKVPKLKEQIEILLKENEDVTGILPTQE